ncbi:MAG: DUF1549 domain-containing protein [Candidatus Hydrogenedentes bacterium]|nr:DUF1549 domain-containing protein [Candidatus Hydrogenedentota bacterium]
MAAVFAFPAFSDGTIRYNRDIRPILAENCFACHGPDKNTRKADLRLDSREGAAEALGTGRDSSEFWKRVSSHDTDEMMPPPAAMKKLTPEQIATLGKWIDAGAPYEKHWAFLPIERVTPPAVTNASWPRNDIDRFVLARQEAVGISPNPEAERRTLVRRVYLDMTGLPPTPERVEAFVNDAAPDAYEKLVDEVLASLHYGERWARHWLDLARFAESHGYEQDYDRKFAYYYRDFVIQAFNQDLPYDTFVKWQIAGDEFAPEDPLAMMATGFLAAGTHATQITKNQVEKERYDELDDMARTIGTSMLGLTIGCARCHDHKYDPITMTDYYRLISTFTKTVRSDYPIDVGPDFYARAKERYDAEHKPLLASLTEYEKGPLVAKFEEWLSTQLTTPPSPQWLALDVFNYTSEGGARMGRLSDGSVLVSGENPEFDTYTFEARTKLTGITSVRIDALSDATMTSNGPGRAENGNFALTNFKVAIRPDNGTDAKTDLKLANPRATFEQAGYPASNAIDADEKSAWAIGEQYGKDQSAIFDFEAPAGLPEGAVFTFTLEFKSNSKHAIGRPRVSITTAPSPAAFDLALMPQDLADTLSKYRAQQDATVSSRDRSRLFEFFKKQDAKWKELSKAEREHAKNAPMPGATKVLISSEGVPAIRTHTQGGDYLEETHFLTRGDPNQKGEVATQAFPVVLVTSPEGEKRWQKAPPAGARTPHKRTALANWITDTEYGAGQLLARVIANRLWQHHFGRGIVPTPSDFGFKGEPPTNPELLDWLASELIANGWSLKYIQKLIMTSATYRQDASHDDAKAKLDPANTLVWHYPRQRLEAEAIRDAMLAVSGQLDDSMFGPSTLDPDMKRRSIYFMVKRSKLVSMMTVFDAPDATVGIDQRPCTTIAPQALLVINNPNVRERAEGLARRMCPDAASDLVAAVTRGFMLTVSRPPGESELNNALAFLDAQTASYAASGNAQPAQTAMADFAQVLLGLNEFVYIE